MTKLFGAKLLFAGFLFCCAFPAFAQSQSVRTPAAEMRGAWVATVGNIDWPSRPGLPPERQRFEFDSLLDVLRAMDFNAVFVQIRPAGDAFYPTPLAPWSEYLNGVQGQAPDPFYDPLQYMIEAAHKRRMEFHAWLNPFRASFDLDTARLAATHPLRTLPKERLRLWFFQYGSRFYFNPANPLVVQHLNSLVRDILLRYDVDGIHFDDYFYPYPIQNQVLDDFNEFSSDPRGFTRIEDWRRDNVNRLVQSVSETIRTLKPYVRFGVGPYGIWRNADRDPVNGSPTRSAITGYDDLYADVLLWMRNGWIDYVAPQLYWSIGFPAADYGTLVDWWSKNTSGKHLYIGHAVYKINSDGRDPNWNQPDQIGRQIRINRANPNVQGSLFYSVKPLLRNPLGVQDTLIREVYSTPALVPPTKHLSKTPPATAQFCSVAGSDSSVLLSWNLCDLQAGLEIPYYFGLFRFPGDRIGNFDDAQNLIAITPFFSEKWAYQDMSAIPGEYYTYVLVGYNRLNVEGYASEPAMIKKTRSGIKKKRRLFGYW